VNRADVPAQTLDATSRLLARRIGLRLNPSVTGRVSRSIADEADAHRLDLITYCDRIEADPLMFQGLVDRLTVQETSFFRNTVQLDAFQGHVLASLAQPVRIWSAGCSNGQEPYTLAMLLLESGVTDWQVTATDVSSRAIERVKHARYSAKEMTTVPAPLRERYFRRAGVEWEVVGAIRERVRSLQHNLVTDPSPFQPGECDVVFCRNVLIYLGDDAVVSTLERFARCVRPRGWLFLGYSESLLAITDVFELARVGEAFAYRLPEHAAPSRTQRPTLPDEGSRRARPPRSGGGTAAGPPLKARTKVAPSSEPSAPAAGAGSVAHSGQRAMDAGDFGAAVVAYRKFAYLEPDQPLAHLHLGLASRPRAMPPRLGGPSPRPGPCSTTANTPRSRPPSRATR